eukprot:585333-Prymnesium_polylepis.1
MQDALRWTASSVQAGAVDVEGEQLGGKRLGMFAQRRAQPGGAPHTSRTWSSPPGESTGHGTSRV